MDFYDSDLEIEFDKYDLTQLSELKKAKNMDLDYKLMANPAFDWFQMAEIREGLLFGLDVSVYAKEKFDYLVMREIKLSMIDGIDIMDFAKMGYRGSVLKQLRLARMSNVNIDIFIREKYDGDQLEEIRKALEDGIDIASYINVDFFGSQIHEIALGLQNEIDVSVYNTGDYNWFQMREIRLGLESHVDVSCYARPLLQYKQMREIRLGLEAGLNAASYAMIKYSPEKMQSIREELIEQSHKEHEKQVNEEIMSRSWSQNVSKKGLYLPSELDAELEYARGCLRIDFSENNMKASMTCDMLMPEKHKFNKEVLLYMVAEAGIKAGVQLKLIEVFAEAPILGETIVLATGKPAVDGQDGFFKFFVHPDELSAPAIMPDGSVDYTNMEPFKIIKKGEKIACYNHATNGEYGYDVFGKMIAPNRGKELPLLIGNGFTISEDRTEYIAMMDGKIEIEDERKVVISKVHIVDGNLEVSMGNIRFDGDVIVKGDVLGGVSIHATGNVKIDGHVENATIECELDCVIGKGMQGNNSGKIKAGGNVLGKFFEYSTIEAKGDIKANYLLNCNAEAEGKIVMNGSKGLILGGTTRAVRGIEVHDLGNDAQVKTELNVGVTKSLELAYQKASDRMKEVQDEIQIFRDGKMKYEKKMQAETLSSHETYGKILQAIEIKQKEYEGYLREEARLLKIMMKAKEAVIQCRGGAYPGVRVTISNNELMLTKKVFNVNFLMYEDHVAVFNIH